MSPCCIAATRELWVLVDGTLDPMAASALRARIASACGPVVLDFTRARGVHDLGLAMLVHGFAKDGIAVTYHGLSEHHQELLRRLGLFVGALKTTGRAAGDRAGGGASCSGR